METLGVSGVTDRAGLEEYIKKSWAAETLWLDLDSTTMWNTGFNPDADMSEALAKHLKKKATRFLALSGTDILRTSICMKISPR